MMNSHSLFGIEISNPKYVMANAEKVDLGNPSGELIQVLDLVLVDVDFKCCNFCWRVDAIDFVHYLLRCIRNFTDSSTEIYLPFDRGLGVQIEGIANEGNVDLRLTDGEDVSAELILTKSEFLLSLIVIASELISSLRSIDIDVVKMARDIDFSD